VLTHTSESSELTESWSNPLVNSNSTKGALRSSFFLPSVLIIINRYMENTKEDGRWNWWGLLEIEPEVEEEDGTDDE